MPIQIRFFIWNHGEQKTVAQQFWSDELMELLTINLYPTKPYFGNGGEINALLDEEKLKTMF